MILDLEILSCTHSTFDKHLNQFFEELGTWREKEVFFLMEPVVFVVMIAEALGASIKGREIFGCLEKENGSHPPPNAAQTKSTQIQDSLNKPTGKQGQRN